MLHLKLCRGKVSTWHPHAQGYVCARWGDRESMSIPGRTPRGMGRVKGRAAGTWSGCLLALVWLSLQHLHPQALCQATLWRGTSASQIRRKLYTDLSGRMNRGKWSPLSWKTAVNSALFQGAFLQERVYLLDHSFHAVLNVTETTNTEQSHRSQSGDCQFLLSNESILVTQQRGADWQSHSRGTQSLENPP